MAAMPASNEGAVRVIHEFVIVQEVAAGTVGKRNAPPFEGAKDVAMVFDYGGAVLARHDNRRLRFQRY